MSQKLILGNNISIYCHKGDITQPPTEADFIVNPSNQFLWRHAPGGAESAIWNAAGKDNIIESLKKVKAVLPVSPGFVTVTNAFNLRRRGYRYIIHAVGPNRNIPEQADEKFLIQTYSHVLEAARMHMKSKDSFSINTVGISSGVFGFSKLETINALIVATSKLNNDSPIKQINLIDNDSITTDEPMKNIFETVVQAYQNHSTQ